MSATLKLTHKAIGVEVRRGTFDVVVDGERVGSVEMNDTRKIGKNLFPVHRNATTWPSAASKVRVRLKFRPLRTCRV